MCVGYAIIAHAGLIFAGGSRPFDPSALCAGGSHVTKYSAAKPVTLSVGTTLKAIACAKGGNSAVVQHVLHVQAPPGIPVLQYRRPEEGQDTQSNAPRGGVCSVLASMCACA